jgi:hypothetical protein
MRQLEEQFRLAKGDRSHFLAPVLDAAQKGAKHKAARLFTKILEEADTDQGHPLHQFALFAYRLPIFRAEMENRISQIEANGLADLLAHMDLEQAFNIGGAFLDAEKARASRKGAGEGGRKGALTQQGRNGVRDSVIRASKEAVSVLAARYGLTQPRIRQIKKRPRG